MDLVTRPKRYDFGLQGVHGVPVDEYVHKSSYLPLIVQDALPKPGILRVQAAKDIRKRIALQPDRVPSLGIFLEGSWEDDLDLSPSFGHVRTRPAGRINLFGA